MRPMWMEYPLDKKTFGIDTNYMFGDCFLIGATYPDLDRTIVYLPPEDDWYDFYNSELISPSDHVRELKMA